MIRILFCIYKYTHKQVYFSALRSIETLTTYIKGRLT